MNDPLDDRKRALEAYFDQKDRELSRALSRTTRGRAQATIPSRFLEDLPEDAIERGLSTARATTERVTSHVARVRAMLGEGG